MRQLLVVHFGFRDPFAPLCALHLSKLSYLQFLFLGLKLEIENTFVLLVEHFIQAMIILA